MQQVQFWWLAGGALVPSLAVWLAWHAYLDREVTNFRESIGRIASHYASRFFGPGGLAQVADRLSFAGRPPRLPFQVIRRWRRQRTFDRGRTRSERKEHPAQHYLALTFAWQQNGELAVLLEPAIGLSVWHAFRALAADRGWQLGDVASVPPPDEPDGQTATYFLTADQSALVYFFANPGLFTRMRSRLTTIGRYLCRVATRAWFAFLRAWRRAFRKSPRR